MAARYLISLKKIENIVLSMKDEFKDDLSKVDKGLFLIVQLFTRIASNKSTSLNLR